MPAAGITGSGEGSESVVGGLQPDLLDDGLHAGLLAGLELAVGVGDDQADLDRHVGFVVVAAHLADDLVEVEGGELVQRFLDIVGELGAEHGRLEVLQSGVAHDQLLHLFLLFGLDGAVGRRDLGADGDDAVAEALVGVASRRLLEAVENVVATAADVLEESTHFRDPSC